jgi:Phosphoesterase family
VHVNYWDDDQPMMYFKDVREGPSYCAAHLVPLESLPADLQHASTTTPNFAWIAPDDCFDMEGCGIAAGDGFVRQELGLIMRSPAWRTQRSLAIITFDEDGYDYEHPAQKVATIMIGSRGVRQGYVSTARYTHYSLLRTIEAALGLGTLTENDRYATPTNDVFTRPGTAHAGPPAAALPAPAVAAPPASAGPAPAGPAGPAGPIGVGYSPASVTISASGTAYVVNTISGTVTPVSAATGRAGRAISVGRYDYPVSVDLGPAGDALVLDTYAGQVTPVSTATGHVYPAITVGDFPVAAAIAS